MATTGLKIAIIGCGPAAKDHLDRLSALPGVSLVGCSDLDPEIARSFAAGIAAGTDPVPAFADHGELLRATSPDALAIFSPEWSHYRAAMDGLQAGCHLLIGTPLSTSVQESVDIVNLARGRDRKVTVGHHFRHIPSLIRARELVRDGRIGRLRLITGTSTGSLKRSDMALPVSGSPLAGSGFRLVDGLLWASGQSAEAVAAARSVVGAGDEAVTAATIRLTGGVLASMAIACFIPSPTFELDFHGEDGRLRVTDRSLTVEDGAGDAAEITLPEPDGDVATDFVGAILHETPPCCPASEAIDAVRVLEAIARSAAIGQFVGLG